MRWLRGVEISVLGYVERLPTVNKGDQSCLLDGGYHNLTEIVRWRAYSLKKRLQSGGEIFHRDETSR